MQQFTQRLTGCLFLRQATHLFCYRVHKGDAHLFIGADHRFADGIQGDRHALFLLKQRLIKIAQRRNILTDAQHALNAPLFAQLPVSLRAHPALSLGIDHAVLHMKSTAQLNCLLHRQRGVLAIGRMEQMDPEVIAG